MSQKIPSESQSIQSESLLNTLLTGIQHGDSASLARAITLAESRRGDHQALFRELLKQLPVGSNSIRIGITGLPGAGKSTFIEALGKEILKENHRIAVLAIDPSSPLHKGSILGDKTRMPNLSADPRVFIRPSPSSGFLGGITATTFDVIQLCEAAGYDVILIESVGIGQSEMTISSVSDLLVLLLIAGAGDELQGIKSGVLEVADLVAINKAEGEQRRAAERTLNDYQMAFGLRNSASATRLTALCSALTGEGIHEIWAQIKTRLEETQASGLYQKRRNNQKSILLEEAIRKHLELAFKEDSNVQKALHLAQEELGKESHSIEELAFRVVESFRKG